MNKKLIFIVGAGRSGTTLLLSYLCGLKNTKILYETKCLTNPDNFSPAELLEYLADTFDSMGEEIVIEKTPDHCLHLDVIEQLRKVCKRDIHIIYVTRPPVPTILSMLKAKEVLGIVDILGACEKYEESMASTYHNLVTRTHEGYICKVKKPFKNISGYFGYRTDSKGNISPMSFTYENILVPYGFHVSYRALIENSYLTLHSLLIKELHLDLSNLDIRSLVTNRISNVTKILPQILEEKHHTNVLREIEEVEDERKSNISKQINEGFSKKYIEKSSYIRNYFEHPTNKETIYDVIVNKKVLDSIDNPLVTIVVPLYNKESYIEETLSSLLSQTYKNVRVIVVDDASTDSSLNLVEKYYQSLPIELKEKLFIIRSHINRGVSHARNLALKSLVKTDIYSFCDADDIWDRTLVEKSIEIYRKYPYVDCVYSRVLVEKDGKVTKLHSKICNGNVFLDAINSNILNCGSNLFVKASFLNEKNIQFDESITNVEDWEFLLRLALEGAVFKCTKEYLVIYRQTPESVTKDRFKQLNCSKKVLYNYIFDKANSIESSKRREMFCSSFTRRFCFYFSFKNITWDNIKDLDFSYILKVIISKLKSFVKLYLL